MDLDFWVQSLRNNRVQKLEPKRKPHPEKIRLIGNKEAPLKCQDRHFHEPELADCWQLENQLIYQNLALIGYYFDLGNKCNKVLPPQACHHSGHRQIHSGFPQPIEQHHWCSDIDQEVDFVEQCCNHLQQVQNHKR